MQERLSGSILGFAFSAAQKLTFFVQAGFGLERSVSLVWSLSPVLEVVVWSTFSLAFNFKHIIEYLLSITAEG